MPNPADKFNEVAKSQYNSQNSEGLKDLRAVLDFMDKAFRYKGIVKSYDSTYGGLYTVDLYENSFGEAATKINLEAIAVDEPLRYKENTPVDLIRLRNDLWAIPRPTRLFHFKITSDAYDDANDSNFIKGIPCSAQGNTVLTEKLTLDLEYNYPSNQTKTSRTPPDPDDIVLVSIYDVPLTYAAANSIAETTSIGLIMSKGGGGGGNAIIDIQWNSTTKKIEVKFSDDPDTWVEKITFEPQCDE